MKADRALPEIEEAEDIARGILRAAGVSRVGIAEAQRLTPIEWIIRSHLWIDYPNYAAHSKDRVLMAVELLHWSARHAEQNAVGATQDAMTAAFYCGCCHGALNGFALSRVRGGKQTAQKRRDEGKEIRIKISSVIEALRKRPEVKLTKARVRRELAKAPSQQKRSRSWLDQAIGDALKTAR